jgi:EmrB/QacA subfamily drug resistance transporter
MTEPAIVMTPLRRRALTVVLAMTVLIVVIDITILNVALESIQSGLSATNAELQWSINSYMITFGAFIFTGGVFADRYGRKRTLLLGLVAFGVTSVFAAYSDSIGQLIAWRSLMGVAAAVIPTVTLSVIINDFPPQDRAKGIAAWAATGGVALAVGPVVGGLLLTEFWWGSVFLINAPLVAACIVAIVRLVPESGSQRDNKFDPAGVLISIVASGALVYGIVTGGENNEWGTLQVLGPIVGGLLLAGLLIVVERRVASPALDVKLFSSDRFSGGTAVIALAFFAFMGAIFILTFYFQAVRGYSPLRAGMLMLPMGIGALLTSTATPRLMRQYGPRSVVVAGTLTLFVILLAYSQVAEGTAVAVLIGLQFVFGLGWGCIMAPATASLMSVVPPQKAGAGQAVAQTLRQIGSALGVAIIGSLTGALYRSDFGSTADQFPEAMRHDAGGSIGGTLGGLQAVGQRIRELTPLAENGDQSAAAQLDALTALSPPAVVADAVDAYMSSMQVTMLVTAAITLVAAGVAWRWLPVRLGPPPGAPTTAPAAPASAPEPAPAPAASEPAPEPVSSRLASPAPQES